MKLILVPVDSGTHRRVVALNPTAVAYLEDAGDRTYVFLVGGQMLEVPGKTRDELAAELHEATA